MMSLPHLRSLAGSCCMTHKKCFDNKGTSSLKITFLILRGHKNQSNLEIADRPVSFIMAVANVLSKLKAKYIIGIQASKNKFHRYDDRRYFLDLKYFLVKVNEASVPMGLYV